MASTSTGQTASSFDQDIKTARLISLFEMKISNASTASTSTTLAHTTYTIGEMIEMIMIFLLTFCGVQSEPIGLKRLISECVHFIGVREIDGARGFLGHFLFLFVRYSTKKTTKNIDNRKILAMLHLAHVWSFDRHRWADDFVHCFGRSHFMLNGLRIEDLKNDEIDVLDTLGYRLTPSDNDVARIKVLWRHYLNCVCPLDFSVRITGSSYDTSIQYVCSASPVSPISPPSSSVCVVCSSPEIGVPFTDDD